MSCHLSHMSCPIGSCPVAHIQKVSVWSASICVAQCNIWKCAYGASFSHLRLQYVHVVPQSIVAMCNTAWSKTVYHNKQNTARKNVHFLHWQLSRGKLKRLCRENKHVESSQDSTTQTSWCDACMLARRASFQP